MKIKMKRRQLREIINEELDDINKDNEYKVVKEGRYKVGDKVNVSIVHMDRPDTTLVMGGTVLAETIYENEPVIHSGVIAEVLGGKDSRYYIHLDEGYADNFNSSGGNVFYVNAPEKLLSY